MTDRLDERTLDEIGRVMQEWDTADSDVDEPSPIERWKRLARHLIERGLLIPRAEHEAAIAATVQAAVFSCEAKAERILRVRNSRQGFQSVLEGEINVLHDAAREIGSLATPAQQDALREAKAEAVSAALDRLWEIFGHEYCLSPEQTDGLRQAMDKVRGE